MTVGEFVDFIIEWNRMNDPDQEEENKPTRRKATQADIDAFWG
jgi:hypothetical protein